jgi:plastocyanin
VSSRSALAASLAAAALASVAAGCAGAGASGPPVATTHVEMAKSYRFAPEKIEVEAGATVTWKNDDNFTHTVKVDGRPDHKVGRGDSTSIRFDRPGTYHYTCLLHPHDMQGEVIVR